MTKILLKNKIKQFTDDTFSQIRDIIEGKYDKFIYSHLNETLEDCFTNNLDDIIKKKFPKELNLKSKEYDFNIDFEYLLQFYVIPKIIKNMNLNFEYSIEYIYNHFYSKTPIYYLTDKTDTLKNIDIIDNELNFEIINDNPFKRNKKVKTTLYKKNIDNLLDLRMNDNIILRINYNALLLPTLKWLNENTDIQFDIEFQKYSANVRKIIQKSSNGIEIIKSYIFGKQNSVSIFPKSCYYDHNDKIKYFHLFEIGKIVVKE